MSLRFAAIALSAALVAGCSASEPETLVPIAAPAAVPVSVPTATAAAQAGRPVPQVLPAGAPVQATALAPVAAPSAPASPVVDAAIATTHLEIAPVTGAPAAAIGPMSRAMASRGREIGLDFTRGGTITTHKLRGFFSVNDDGAETRVVYIWDVLSPQGRRLHRIQGQERLPASGGDAWRAVSTGTMERIGRSTIDRFADWRRKQG